MLGGEPGALTSELTQPLGMNAVGACRIEADRLEHRTLLDEARQGSMAGGSRWLACPGQVAQVRIDRRSSSRSS